MSSEADNAETATLRDSDWHQFSARSVRLAAREGALTGPTPGMADGYVQANLVILPESDAGAFLRFCQSNPRPCPVLAVGGPGDFRIPELGDDLDIRRDIPRYRVFRNGEVINEPTDVTDLWREDLVVFALGCSFTFERALIADGIPLRHVAMGRNIAMYRTNLALREAGPFGGHMVVSMRPLQPRHAIRSVQICTRFPLAHGAPIHLGFPEQIGVQNLACPDFGEPVPMEPSELPVFWACGVTPQQALEQAELDFAITHSPGHMLVTDISEHQLSII